MRRLIPAVQFVILALEDEAPALFRWALRWS